MLIELIQSGLMSFGKLDFSLKISFKRSFFCSQEWNGVLGKDQISDLMEVRNGSRLISVQLFESLDI